MSCLSRFNETLIMCCLFFGLDMELTWKKVFCFKETLDMFGTTVVTAVWSSENHHFGKMGLFLMIQLV